jgi:hypothetical protein
MSLTGFWFGHAGGTNIGLITARLIQDEERFAGELVFSSTAGRNTMCIEGMVQNNRLSATVSQYEAEQSGPPGIVHLQGLVEHDNTYISGEWKTDISTRGQFILSKVADSKELPLEAVLKRVPESQPSVIRSTTQEYDTRNFPIEPFYIRDKDLEELNRIFAEYAHKAREIEDTATRAITPSPSISMIGAYGEVIVVSNVNDFSASRLPYNLKNIRFSNYTQA